MRRLVWKRLVGQERIKDTLKAAFDGNALGHAYLFSGSPGVGKLQAALELGMALLCTGADEVPCGECESCRLVLRHAHPDFNLVFPVEPGREHRSSGKLNEAGWAYLAEQAAKRVEDPYLLEEFDGYPQIPVEWIRELNHAVQRGSSRGHGVVAIICGIDTMNAESANAMLKTLEEPPPGTTLILCSDRPHAVLPTVLSRCQVLRFGYLAQEPMIAALAAMCGRDPSDRLIAGAVRCAGGSLGRARALVVQPLDEQLATARGLLELCVEPDWLTTASGLEALVAGDLNDGRDYGAVERILTYVMYVIRDAVSAGIEGGRNYFSDDSSSRLSTVFQSPDLAMGAIELCREAIEGVRARGNVMLVLTTFLIAMREVIHEQEQQPR